MALVAAGSCRNGSVMNARRAEAITIRLPRRIWHRIGRLQCVKGCPETQCTKRSGSLAGAGGVSSLEESMRKLRLDSRQLEILNHVHSAIEMQGDFEYFESRLDVDGESFVVIHAFLAIADLGTMNVLFNLPTKTSSVFLPSLSTVSRRWRAYWRTWRIISALMDGPSASARRWVWMAPSHQCCPRRLPPSFFCRAASLWI